MKSLKCSELSGLECEFEATGETAEEVKKALLDHGMKEHADVMAAMSEDQKRMLMEKADKMLSEG
ncbi:MAG: DUF1059 domain-containing protein [Candidatus Altiarchaeales archaeon]|nr:DUF1059 domain-containing protein [Candidatus Altiarchaeales archaeon]MBD3416467.1 DUF1059 domain-containing protein [Candidatus Altiarchaeales archaeon]